MAIHSSILAWKVPWTEEPGGLQSIGSRRVEHDWSDLTHTHTHTHTHTQTQTHTDTHTHRFLVLFQMLQLEFACHNEDGRSHVPTKIEDPISYVLYIYLHIFYAFMAYLTLFFLIVLGCTVYSFVHTVADLLKFFPYIYWNKFTQFKPVLVKDQLYARIPKKSFRCLCGMSV